MSERPLSTVVVTLVRKVGQHVGRIAVASIGKATQLLHVAPLACQLDKLIHGVSVPVRGTCSQVQ